MDMWTTLRVDTHNHSQTDALTLAEFSFYEFRESKSQEFKSQKSERQEARDRTTRQPIPPLSGGYLN